jgi:hypothetical protein
MTCDQKYDEVSEKGAIDQLLHSKSRVMKQVRIPKVLYTFVNIGSAFLVTQST